MLQKKIELWLEGVMAGLGICGFNHDVIVEPTNGKWDEGESFRISFRHEDWVDDDIGFSVLSGIVYDFRRVFDAKVGEYPTMVEDDVYSAVVEDVHGPRGL